MSLFRALAAFALAMLPASAAASPLDFPRRVLFVGNENTPRTKAFVELLENHFAEVLTADRKSFDSDSAEGVDVVLLDWSQQDAKFPDDPSPLGERASWQTPTVFLGSAGLLVAVQWQIIGGSG